MKTGCIFFIYIFISLISHAQNKSDELLMQEGDNYYSLDKYNLAKDVYEELYKRDTSNMLFAFRLGVCYQQLEEYDKADSLFKETILKKYRIADSYINLSVSAVKKDLYSEALSYLLKAKNLFPNNLRVNEAIEQVKLMINMANYDSI